jgi:hypothetical protein
MPRAETRALALTADWTLEEVIKHRYPLKKDDKIESLADFFIYRKGPVSGSAYVTD